MEDADKMIMREKIEDLQMWMGLKEVQRSLLGGGPHMTQDTGHGSPPDQVCEYYCARVPASAGAGAGCEAQCEAEFKSEWPGAFNT